MAIKGIILLAVILLILLAFFIRFIFITQRRKYNFGGSDPERYIYSDIMKIIRVGGVNCDESRPFESTGAVVSVFKGIRHEEYERMISIMQKNIFGQQQLKKRELYALISFYKKIRKILYANNNGFKNFVIRFFYCI